MKRALPVFILFFLIGALLYGRIMIDGDGLTYYALARSVVEDHDFDLKNQRQQVWNLHLKINPVTRRIASHFSFGFGLLYAPFLYVADTTLQYQTTLAQWQPYHQNRIIPFLHSVAIFTGSVFYGFLTIFTGYLILRKNTGSRKFAILLPIVVLAGTPLMFYIFTSPSYAHAADALLVTLVFWLVVLKNDIYFREWNLSNICIGLLLSLSVLLRNNNIVLIPPMVLAVLYWQSKKQDRNPVSVVAEIFLGALPGILLLARFNLSQYGTFFATGYRVQLEEQFLGEMLIHPYAGLFIWTPLTLFALVGLIAGSVKRHPEAIISLACVMLVLLSVQFQPNWWGGCAFGPRFFTHLFVFWLWGLLECRHLLPKHLVWIAVLLCAGWTFFLFNLFYITSTSADFRAMLRANKCRRSPGDMIASAVSEYASASKTGESTNPIAFWVHSFDKGRFPTVQSILRRTQEKENEPVQLEEEGE